MPSFSRPGLVTALVWVLVAGLSAGGVGLAVLRGTDFGALPDDRPRERPGQGPDDTFARVAERCTQKRRLAEEVIDGRLGLLEAARRYRDLDEQPPPFYWEAFRRTYPGASDDERHCRNVIGYVGTALQDRPDADPALVARLEAELEDLLRRGDLRLPGPVAAPPDGP